MYELINGSLIVSTMPDYVTQLVEVMERNFTKRLGLTKRLVLILALLNYYQRVASFKCQLFEAIQRRLFDESVKHMKYFHYLKVLPYIQKDSVRKAVCKDPCYFWYVRSLGQIAYYQRHYRKNLIKGHFPSKGKNETPFRFLIQ